MAEPEPVVVHLTLEDVGALVGIARGADINPVENSPEVLAAWHKARTTRDGEPYRVTVQGPNARRARS